MTPTLVQFDKKRLGDAPGLCGVDEAGRGCLAGPVVAGAVWTEAAFYDNRTRVRLASCVNDSKQLTTEGREEIFALLGHWRDRGVLRFASGEASVMEIGAYNILGATKIAMGRALRTLADASPRGCPFAPQGERGDPLFADGRPAFVPVLVDGRPLRPFAWEHEALVGGDGISLAVAMASIVAKVTRDALMAEMDLRHPRYGFANHKGYGVPEHLLALRRHGPCPEHRELFVRTALGESGPAPKEIRDQHEFGF